MASKNGITIPLTAVQWRRLARVARVLGWGSNVAGYAHQWLGVGVTGVERARIFKKRVRVEYAREHNQNSRSPLGAS
jgi:hypothetical protein